MKVNVGQLKEMLKSIPDSTEIRIDYRRESVYLVRVLYSPSYRGNPCLILGDSHTERESEYGFKKLGT